MPVRPVFLLAATACAFVAGCGSLDSASNRIAGMITPYKVEVVQGNFVSREQVEALKPGISRQQVREVLGTPLVTSLFHADRWDYVFTLKRQGVEPQQRKLTVFFKGDALDRFEGDTMPSEAEFVAALDKRKAGKVPPLEATPEQLKRYETDKPAAAATPPAAVPAPANYPPLEPPAR
ncbi:outer membrane protein assembly factor BamE [Ramlibacter albus]|uniref:Outer membrane protein assembly factor BamE n=1 Tax=Ramlibacter albus TaxID=2079448 RepID=A0A923M771_9BURK|nr:outer membrane protein assembly factor BamE [Ramlibacter albus]MBC5764066.1 outer membrane protein assembly factor BamE [Ramlibacter albus]